jgi:hypothetical protein
MVLGTDEGELGSIDPVGLTHSRYSVSVPQDAIPRAVWVLAAWLAVWATKAKTEAVVAAAGLS